MAGLWPSVGNCRERTLFLFGSRSKRLSLCRHVLSFTPETRVSVDRVANHQSPWALPSAIHPYLFTNKLLPTQLRLPGTGYVTWFLCLGFFATIFICEKAPRAKHRYIPGKLTVRKYPRATAMAPSSEESSGSSTPDGDPKPLTAMIRKLHTNIRQVFGFRRFASSASPAIPEEDQQETRELKNLRGLSVTSVSEAQVSPVLTSSDRLKRHFR